MTHALSTSATTTTRPNTSRQDLRFTVGTRPPLGFAVAIVIGGHLRQSIPSLDIVASRLITRRQIRSLRNTVAMRLSEIATLDVKSLISRLSKRKTVVGHRTKTTDLALVSRASMRLLSHRLCANTWHTAEMRLMLGPRPTRPILSIAVGEVRPQTPLISTLVDRRLYPMANAIRLNASHVVLVSRRTPTAATLRQIATTIVARRPTKDILASARLRRNNTVATIGLGVSGPEAIASVDPTPSP